MSAPGGTSLPDACVLAVDPGRAKCGVAVVRRSGQIAHRSITLTEALPTLVQALLTMHQPCVVVCGNGTGAKPIQAAIQQTSLPVPLVLVDEAHTSEAARVRFLQENKLPLRVRVLPPSLRAPWLPYDDWVAVILAERWWQAQQDVL